MTVTVTNDDPPAWAAQAGEVVALSGRRGRLTRHWASLNAWAFVVFDDAPGLGEVMVPADQLD